MTTRRGILKCTLLLAAVLMAAPSASAQGYPNKPVKIIVPYPPGGSTDAKARFVAEGLQSRLKQPFVVENRPGAATVIAAQALIRSPADGYTLMIATSTTTALAPITTSNAGFTYSDFLPIAQVSRSPWLLDVPANSPFNSVKDLVDYAKANPGKLLYAHQGIGGLSHVIGEQLKASAGINAVPVPFNGSAPALLATMSGQVGMYFDSIATSAPAAQQKQIKALAVTSDKRSSVTPDIPTLVELGYPEVVAYAWNGIFAPVGTPRDIVELLNKEIRAIIATPAIRDRLVSEGSDIPDVTAAQFADFVKSESLSLEKIVKPLNIKAE